MLINNKQSNNSNSKQKINFIIDLKEFQSVDSYLTIITNEYYLNQHSVLYKYFSEELK
jgi:hypothetical protein